MDEQKLFINVEGIVVVKCPECQASKNMDVGRYKKINKAVRIKCRCKCGNTFSVLVERRQYFRKNVNLPGRYISNKGKGPVIIQDISRTGLKFKLSSLPDLIVGDKARLEFHLDDKKHTFISKEVIIKSTSGVSIGAEFCTSSSSDIDADKAIGFYMMHN